MFLCFSFLFPLIEFALASKVMWVIVLLLTGLCIKSQERLTSASPVWIKTLVLRKPMMFWMVSVYTTLHFTKGIYFATTLSAYNRGDLFIQQCRWLNSFVGGGQSNSVVISSEERGAKCHIWLPNREFSKTNSSRFCEILTRKSKFQSTNSMQILVTWQFWRYFAIF